jgi:hypothetical protein
MLLISLIHLSNDIPSEIGLGIYSFVAPLSLSEEKGTQIPRSVLASKVLRV